MSNGATSVGGYRGVIRKALGFEPTGVEQAAILNCEKRFVEVGGGDQSGKSLGAAEFATERILGDKQVGLYWLVAQDYARTRRAFEYIKENFQKLGVLDIKATSKRVDPGRIVLRDGTRIESKSASDPRTLAMDGPNGIIIEEASQVSLDVFERCMLRLAPNHGWLMMSGSFEGSLGWYPALFTAWESGADDRQSFSLPTWSNKHLFPGGRNDPEILRLERESSEAFFNERVAGRPMPPRGLVFKEFRADLHIKEVEWVPGEVVYVWEDPGYGTESAHAVLAAQISKEGQVQVKDEIYERGLVTEEIIEIAKHRPWWDNPKVLVSDPHYKDQHHSTTSVGEIWLAKTGLVAMGERSRILEGIERMKGFLKPDPVFRQPKIVFSPRCKGILSEFGAAPHPLEPYKGQMLPYRWETDREGNITGEVPKDRYNHAIKAVIYGLIQHFGFVTRPDREYFIMKRYGAATSPRTRRLAGVRR